MFVSKKIRKKIPGPSLKIFKRKRQRNEEVCLKFEILNSSPFHGKLHGCSFSRFRGGGKKFVGWRGKHTTIPAFEFSILEQCWLSLRTRHARGGCLRLSAPNARLAPLCNSEPKRFLLSTATSRRVSHEGESKAENCEDYAAAFHELL